MRRPALVNAITWAAQAQPDALRVAFFTPVARSNPFQELLHRELWSSGVAPLGVINLWDLDVARYVHRLGGTAVIHLHWTTEITGRAETEADTVAAGDAFLEQMAGLQGEGVQIVWTIHNRLPHECRFVDAELAFRARLAAQVDRVHVMTQAAIDELRDLYPLPADRTVVIAHPSYLRAYPTYAVQQDARIRLGIPPDALTVAAIGALRSYKGIDRLRRSARRAAQPVHLLVVGEPSSEPDVIDVIETLRRDAHASVITRTVTDRQLSEAIASADIVSSLHPAPFASGSAILAMSLGRPVLTLDRPSARELYQDAGVYVATDDEDELAAAIAGLDRGELARQGERATAIATRWDDAPARYAAMLVDMFSHDPAPRER